MPRYDTAVLNGTVVVPYLGALRCDVGIRAGRISALLRGRTVFRDGSVMREPQGSYVKRPIGLYGTAV